MKLPFGVTFHHGGLRLGPGDTVPPEHEDKIPDHVKAMAAAEAQAPAPAPVLPASDPASTPPPSKGK